jgi:glycosyltransferase involved in cell wall biosynthesis
VTGATATKTQVLQVTHDLDVGGLQRVVQTLCCTIDRSRFDITVLCVRAKGPLAGELEAAGVPVIDLERPANRPDYFPFRRVARVLRERRVDVVHTHNTEPFISGGIGAILAGTPTLIHTDHARPFPDKLRYMVMERLLSYRAHRVVGVSDHTSQNLLRFVKMPRRKVMTIPNGIDGGRFEIPTDRGKKRAELGIAGNRPVVGLGARIVAQKGIVYLLRAIALLKAQFPDILLVIAGEGPLQKELQDTAVQLGLDQNVRFVGVRGDMPEVIQTFDVYALPSLWEGLPSRSGGC